MKRATAILAALAAAALAVAAGTSTHAQAARHAHVVIVVDGLRPDDVTAEVMPRLTAIGRRGIVFNAHHSVFPTVTRVNASSMVTGVYRKDTACSATRSSFPR